MFLRLDLADPTILRICRRFSVHPSVAFFSGAPAGGDALDEEELADLFDAIDTDGNGVISKQEFKARAAGSCRVFKQAGEKCG